MKKKANLVFYTNSPKRTYLSPPNPFHIPLVAEKIRRDLKDFCFLAGHNLKVGVHLIKENEVSKGETRTLSGTYEFQNTGKFKYQIGFVGYNGSNDRGGIFLDTKIIGSEELCSELEYLVNATVPHYGLEQTSYRTAVKALKEADKNERKYLFRKGLEVVAPPSN